jgi:hypothetical protein
MFRIVTSVDLGILVKIYMLLKLLTRVLVKIYILLKKIYMLLKLLKRVLRSVCEGI